jgi:hypothetical protein
MKYVKEELEDLIFVKKLSYREIGRMYSVSDTYIKKISQRLGIQLPRKSIFPEGWVPANKKKPVIINCKNCNTGCDVYAKEYCSAKCQQEYASKKKYQEYFLNPDSYCTSKSNMKWIKKHILAEQNCKCDICNMENTWNNKPIVFILDHIDGNAANNIRSNLRLICHNCDSQLDTYKSKNKNSARKERYLASKKIC